MSQFYGVTEYPNTIKRQGSYPLDKSTVFTSLMEANEYVESSKIAYEGQLISIIENDVIHVCVLKKNNDDPTKNFKLVALPMAEYVIDLYNLMNHKVGNWNITKSNETDKAILDFDIWCDLKVNSYEVYFNDDLMGDKLLLTEEFVTNFILFNKDTFNLKIKFYNDTEEIFEVDAKPVSQNKSVIFGSLYLSNLLLNEEE